jgi:hypothetical protein
LSRPEPGWGHLKRRDGEPSFGEPWHAQALALADLLIASGRLSPARWAEALGWEVRASWAAGERDDTESFFRAALSALERLLAEDGSVTPSEVALRQRLWERAYLNTPHGRPVELSRGEVGS